MEKLLYRLIVNIAPFAPDLISVSASIDIIIIIIIIIIIV
jgi:hypothetical protein